jgi:hypothetical protein
MNILPKRRPGGHRLGPRVVLKLQSGRPSRGDLVVLDRPGPVARPCESFGTQMLPRAPWEDRRREHSVGS